ncbi:lipoprotein [Pseudomonas sp. Boi14]|nr:lipoprotein [Pseudomonas sp. Boi14]
MARRWHLLIPLLIISLLLGACSRVGLAYRNLDVIIPWNLNDYLDMNSEQKSWFNQRLQQHLSWHCTTQLPGYLDWLDRLQLMVQNNQVSDQGLQQRTREAKQAIADTAQQITPSAVELLQGLNDQQVKEMNSAFAKDLQEHQEQYLKPPLAQQIEQRSQRMSKRLNAWLGSLSPSQQQRVEQWSSSLGEQNQQWIANRAHWQAQFSAAVEQRQNSDFPQRIEQLLVHRESLWTPDYRQAYAHTEQAARSLLVDLMAQSTPAQRQRLLKKIDGVRKDFAELKCLQNARQG